MPVSAPSDRRFRRAHVAPTRRRSWWRPSWWMVARAAVVSLVVVFGLYQAVALVLSADALRVSRISVQGNERMSRGEVLALLDGLRGRSMVTADLEAWRQKLLNSPWVADAAIRRVLPGTLTVAISERKPMGIGRIRDALYLVDQDGAIIDEYGPNYSELDLPIIDGLAAVNHDGSLTDERRADLAARLMTALRAKPQVARRVSQIDVTDLHNAAVILSGDPAVIQLGEDQFLPRLQGYLELAPTLRERVADIDYVDLRFDDRIYVRPASAPSALRRGKPAETASGLRRGKPAAVGKTQERSKRK